ncbi:hypothetical protein [Adhaeretor mobilis]|uniref:Uncharacterized protein n=1 Tax=Adhaeretor mobilis TaxID=1930276 RepID=A0A517MT75_9BACT|nr:hypothetical protein [Adhaeretor mobilis]QDS98084.1 hypothetical protein HG15A2_13560 [Adhaeretor mobilis]
MRFAINTLSNLGTNNARLSAKLIVRLIASKCADLRASIERLSALVVVDRLGVHWHALAWQLQAKITGTPVITTPAGGVCSGCVCYATAKRRMQRSIKRRVVAG